MPAKLSAAVRFAATAFFAALLVLAGWSPARALPTLDLASQALAASPAESGLGRGDHQAPNWRVRAPGATQLAARPGPASDLGTATLPGTPFSFIPPAGGAGAFARTACDAAHVPGAQRARAPPTA